MRTKSLVQRKVCQEFSKLNCQSTYGVFNTSQNWFWLSEINARCKREQSAEYTEEVKWLHESCIVFGCIKFIQSDFDKPITFVSLTIAHITVSSLGLLSVCLVGSITASHCSIPDRLAHTTYFLSLLHPPSSFLLFFLPLLLCSLVATYHRFRQCVDEVPQRGISSPLGVLLLNSWGHFFLTRPNQ